MNIEKIRRELERGMDCQFDCSYSWLDMIDDLDNLTAEEKEWAKEHSTYSVKIDGDEQVRDDLLALAKQYLFDVETRISCIKDDDDMGIKELDIDEIAHWEATKKGIEKIIAEAENN